MSWLTDNNIPKQITTYLEARGHSVERSSAALGDTAKDLPIILHARTRRAVVLTFDKDYQQHAQNALAPGRNMHREWGLVLLRYPPARKDRFLRIWIDAIEYEYTQSFHRERDGLIVYAEVYDRRLILHR